MGSRFFRAAESGLSTTMPAPSLRTYPEAAASKARTRPSGAQKPALVRLIVPIGDSSRFAPPARAMSHSPLRMLWQAR